MTNNISEKIYSGMIAGRLANHAGDVAKSIYFLARDTLGVSNIHLLTAEDPDGLHTYYFAGKSGDFASELSPQTPLAAAFPSHPDHRGDGVYHLVLGGTSVVVVKDASSFRILTNTRPVIERLIADLGLDVFDVESSRPYLIESMAGKSRRIADKYSSGAIKVGVIITVIAGLVAIGSMAAHAAFTVSLKKEGDRVERELNALMSKIEHVSPLSSQVADMQRLSATVVRAGGWIDEYSAKGGKIKFVVSLPEWVTQDYIAALGPGTVAEHDGANNVIRVEKK